MNYIDRLTHLVYFQDDLAYGHTVVTEGLFGDMDSYQVAVDGDKMILLSQDVYDKSNSNGTDYKYYIESRAFDEEEGTEITGLYSIKQKKLIDVDNEKLLNLYKSIFWLGEAKEFDLAHLLAEINYRNLGILLREEKNEYYNYLTSGNDKITHDEVINYILENIPELERYTNLKRGLSILDYRKIAKELGKSMFSLQPIRQDLDFLKYNKYYCAEYGIYIPEEEQKQRTLTYRRK